MSYYHCYIWRPCLKLKTGALLTCWASVIQFHSISRSVQLFSNSWLKKKKILDLICEKSGRNSQQQLTSSCFGTLVAYLISLLLRLPLNCRQTEIFSNQSWYFDRLNEPCHYLICRTSTASFCLSDDRHRVKLHSLLADPSSDYVNANYIDVSHTGVSCGPSAWLFARLVPLVFSLLGLKYLHELPEFERAPFLRLNCLLVPAPTS